MTALHRIVLAAVATAHEYRSFHHEGTATTIFIKNHQFILEALRSGIEVRVLKRKTLDSEAEKPEGDKQHNYHKARLEHEYAGITDTTTKRTTTVNVAVLQWTVA